MKSKHHKNKSLSSNGTATPLKANESLVKDSNSAPAGKKKNKKMKKNVLLQALKEKSVVVAPKPSPGIQNPEKKKKNKKKRKQNKTGQAVAATATTEIEQHEVAKNMSGDGDHKKSRKRHKRSSSSIVGLPTEAKEPALDVRATDISTVTESKKQKRKKNKKRKKNAQQEPAKIESNKVEKTKSTDKSEKKQSTGYLAEEKKSTDATFASTTDAEKSHKRNKGAKKADEEADDIQDKQKVSKPADQSTSSDSEPELIKADWNLPKGSDNESDLDKSEEDVDEDDDHDDEDDDEENSESEEDEVKNEKTKTSKKSKADLIERDVESFKVKEAQEEGGKPVGKKFSLLDKTKILAEITTRSIDLAFRSVYLSPIPFNCTFDMLKKLSPKMTCCRFFTKPKSGKLRTYAFLEYLNAETAAQEQKRLSGRLFGSKTIRAEVQGRQPPPLHTEDQIDFSRLLVSGLLPTVTTGDLQTLFPSASSIRLAAAAGAGGSTFNLGSAVLHFVSNAVALDAFSHCHKFLLKGHPISVNFSFKPTSSIVVTPKLKETKKELAEKALIRSEFAPIVATAKSELGKKPTVLVQTFHDSEDESDAKRTLLTADVLTSVQTNVTPASKPVKATEKVVKSAVVKPAVAPADSKTLLISKMFKQVAAEKAIKRQKKREKEISQKESDSDDGSGSEDDEEDVDNDSEDQDEDSKDVEEDSSDDQENSNEEEEASSAEDDEKDSDDGDNAAEEEDEELAKMMAGSNSSDEEAEASLSAALNARRVSAKSLKAPGAKRNWKAGTAPGPNNKKAVKRPGAMPTILPVPGKRRR